MDHCHDLFFECFLAEVGMEDVIQLVSVLIVGIHLVELCPVRILVSFKKMFSLMDGLDADKDVEVLVHMGIKKNRNLKDFVLFVVVYDEVVCLLADFGKDEAEISSFEGDIILKKPCDGLLIEIRMEDFGKLLLQHQKESLILIESVDTLVCRKGDEAMFDEIGCSKGFSTCDLSGDGDGKPGILTAWTEFATSLIDKTLFNLRLTDRTGFPFLPIDQKVRLKVAASFLRKMIGPDGGAIVFDGFIKDGFCLKDDVFDIFFLQHISF